LNHVARSHRHLWLTLAVLLLIFGYTARAANRPPLFEAFKPVIVVDPGHGGQDVGAQGPDGSLEKTVTLTLARLIAAQLEPEFRVVLTRTDDYRVEMNQRTALANNLKAKILISIHTGAGFVHSKTGTTIFYYRSLSQPSAQPEKSAPSDDSDPGGTDLWENIQIRHIEQSRALARAIYNRLDGGSTVQSMTEGLPLAVLQGAAMPAVLIEVGHLTNPAEEKQLNDSRYLTDLAEQIRLGVEDFIAQNE